MCTLLGTLDLLYTREKRGMSPFDRVKEARMKHFNKLFSCVIYFKFIDNMQ
jgi:hypothetical protein